MFLGFVWDWDSGFWMDLTIRTYFDVQNGIDLTNLQAGSKYAKHEPSIPEYPN